jgi:hypothetical protein
MSYTDYLKRKALNTPKVIDTQMRMSDASSFTWRTKMLATQVNRRTDHVINNTQDLGIAPRLFSPQVMCYPGSGSGGKVQDASSFTQSRSATATGRDTFKASNGTRRIQTIPVNADGRCVALAPASQVVSERGNADNSLNNRIVAGLPVGVTIWNNTGSNMSWKTYASKGLNMGYTAQRVNNRTIPNIGVCTQRFFPQTKSQFVDTIPDLLTDKIGSRSDQIGTATDKLGLGRDTVQGTIRCTTTNTSGNVKGTATDGNGINLPEVKADQPFNSYSKPPHNPAKALFVTGIQGPQVGGAQFPGGRAIKPGGVSIIRKGVLTHRGWGGRTRTPYPNPYVPPNGAPAHVKM